MRNEFTEKLLKLAAARPDLPIIPLVDSDIIEDGDGWYEGHLGFAEVSKIAHYQERYFDDWEDFKEFYYDHNCTELDDRFNYLPLCCSVTVDAGNYTQEQFEANCLAEAALDEYLDEIAKEYFKEAILLYIGVPKDEES